MYPTSPRVGRLGYLSERSRAGEETSPNVDDSVYTAYGCGVGETTTIRISRDTHARVTRLAAERHETIDETVSKAIRALRQDAMGRDLAAELTEDETAWLDADAG